MSRLGVYIYSTAVYSSIDSRYKRLCLTHVPPATGLHEPQVEHTIEHPPIDAAKMLSKGIATRWRIAFHKTKTGRLTNQEVDDGGCGADGKDARVTQHEQMSGCPWQALSNFVDKTE